ncbi:MULTISPECIES: hypothetical protein [unclassified Paenibacillus]|uniref:DNA polymerase III subunit beta n=1 Tax=unclassified Paenibacillus TaxID=185978 RepID=UPI002786343B|nr:MULTISPECIES: hypothetical protein [unclassified Paenibacillus]MDQ0896241.1 DNA polymerase-3 subunit beta [Paenibacillus sp. V4I7]MDQ0913831.1 DNA polymerase-3 subunit beta [Paenibacillus sp. V4I5]
MSTMTDLLLQQDEGSVQASTDKNAVIVKIKDRKQFLSMVEDVAKAAATSDSIPVLEMIKMEIKKSVPRRKTDGSGEMENVPGNALTLVGSDGTITIVKAVAAVEGAENSVIEADREISVLIPAVTFSKICSNLPAGDFRLELEEERLTIKAGKAKYQLATQDVSMYPNIQTETDAVSFSTRSKEFCSVIKETLYAVSKDESRPQICGVQLKGTDSGVLLQSTNLKLASLQLLAVEVTPFEGIVSHKTAKLILEVFDKTDGPVRVSIGPSLITVAGIGVMIVSKLITGNVIDLETQLPRSFASECTVNRKELEDAFKRAMSVTGKEQRGVNFKLVSGEFHITAKGELGNGEESIFVTDATGDMKGCVDAEVMKDTLKSLEAYEQIHFSWLEPLKPYILAPVLKDGESSNRRAVVVPLRSREV